MVDFIESKHKKHSWLSPIVDHLAAGATMMGHLVAAATMMGHLTAAATMIGWPVRVATTMGKLAVEARTTIEQLMVVEARLAMGCLTEDKVLPQGGSLQWGIHSRAADRGGGYNNGMAHGRGCNNGVTHGGG
jgi:hypothetical protein